MGIVIKYLRELVMSLALVSLLFACYSSVTVEPDASEAQILYAAQVEFNNGNYDSAREYYNVLMQRYGDDASINITTSYELAYIDYKQKRYDEARAQFLNIQSRYENDEQAPEFPLWPLVLTEYMLAQLSE